MRPDKPSLLSALGIPIFGIICILCFAVSLKWWGRVPPSEEPKVVHQTLDDEIDGLLDLRGLKRLDFALPHYPEEMAAIPQSPLNPINRAKVELGRQLFSLADANGASCASCHVGKFSGFSGDRHNFGFGGHGHDGLIAIDAAMLASHGLDAPGVRAPSPLGSAWRFGQTVLVDGKLGGSAIGANAGYDFSTAPFPASFNDWADGLLPGVEIQALVGQGIHKNASHFGSDRPDLGNLAVAAFPDLSEATARSLNEDSRGLAMAAFERAWVPSRSAASLWGRGDDDALTPRMKEGLVAILKMDCVACHAPPTMEGGFHNLGCPDLDGGHEEKGRVAVTGNPKDERAFRASSWYNLRDAVYAFHGADARVWEFHEVLQRHSQEATEAETLAIRELILEGFFDAQARDFLSTADEEVAR